MTNDTATSSEGLFALFSAAAGNAVEAARLTRQLFASFPDQAHVAQQVKDLEHQGDSLTGDIMQLLNRGTDLPFDREDVYLLAKTLDDIVDFMEEAVDRLVLYQVEASMQQAIDQCDVLVGAAAQLAVALAALPTPDRVPAELARLKELEDEGDRILRVAMADLFADADISPRTIIQWKDIFEALEDAIDACETAGHVLGNIAVKRA